jgi:hypothetical protein
LKCPIDSLPENFQVRKFTPAALCFMSVASNPDLSGLSRVVDRCKLLLGDVNLFFLVHVAQEKEKAADAKHNGQDNCADALPSPHSAWTRENVKLINRAQQ